MQILDKLYLHFYWCWNDRKDSPRTDQFLDKVWLLILWSVSMLLLPALFDMMGWHVCVTGELVFSFLPALLLYKPLFRMYYSDKRKDAIISQNAEPGELKFAVLLGLFVLATLMLLGASFGAGFIRV